LRAAKYLPSEATPTAVHSVAMSMVPHTSGLTECQSGSVTYPVLGGITTVQATPAFPGVHLPVSVVPTLVPATSTLATTAITATQFKQPPAFKELHERINKFSGESKEDFVVWLADYCEAIGDYGWSDELRARWFSWCS